MPVAPWPVGRAAPPPSLTRYLLTCKLGKRVVRVRKSSNRCSRGLGLRPKPVRGPRGSECVTYHFQFRDVLAFWPSLLDGVAITLMLAISGMAGGLLVGILGAAARLYGPRPLRLLAVAYVEAIRNTPLLVQLFLVFFGLPQIGLRFDAPVAAIATLVVNVGAYATEIVRAGLQAIPRTQVEAGHALGLSGIPV